MAHYKDSKYDNTVLWYYMKEDFVGWTKETWVPVNKDIIQDFHNFLQEYKVFVPIDGGVIGNNIQEHVIDTKKEHQWTSQEIKHQLHTIKKLNSQWNSSSTPLETHSNSIAPGISSPILPLSSIAQNPSTQSTTSITAPQLKQMQDPLIL